jgi:ATP-dependent DNA helicase RecG
MCLLKRVKESVIKATSEKVYLRKGAQNLPLTAEAIDRLKFDKGIKSYEDEILNIDHDEISNSETVIEFMLGTVPTGEPKVWLGKQRLLDGERPTVAGVLLFSDIPQVILPKRSAVKILRDLSITCCLGSRWSCVSKSCLCLRS